MVNIIMGQMLLHARVSSKQSSYVITNGLVTLNVEQSSFPICNQMSTHSTKVYNFKQKNGYQK